jgi:hypothetical protein
MCTVAAGYGTANSGGDAQGMNDDLIAASRMRPSSTTIILMMAGGSVFFQVTSDKMLIE